MTKRVINNTYYLQHGHI